MLVLARKREEVIVIECSDGLIEIKIVDIRTDSRGQDVQVGIDAPRNVSINRREVYERIQREGKQRP